MPNTSLTTQASNGPLRPRRRWLARGLAVSISMVLSLLVVEVMLHLFPRFVPAAMRQRFPPNGVEFFVPGLLDRTPINGVPIPTGLQPYEGRAPHDVEDIGIARGGVASHDLEVPQFVLPVDVDGLINAKRHAQPDLLLVGDSFAALAGQTQPVGLVQRLEEKLAIKVFNIGVPGIGPIPEAWLLRSVGVKAKPRVVVWFVYGGNDFQDTFYLLQAMQGGAETYGDLCKDSRRPFWILPGVFTAWCASVPPPPNSPLEPFHLRDRPDVYTWFHPDTLRFYAMSEAMLGPSPAVAALLQALADGRDAVRDIGAEFLLVYLPSKEQTWLPLAEWTPELLMAYLRASMHQYIAVPDEAEATVALLRKNGGAFEQIIADWCQAEQVRYWSATETLRAAVLAGKRPFYRADSHWRAEGQEACLGPLSRQLRELGLGR